MTRRPRRGKTPAYRFFYILFSPDTWRVLLGLAAAFLLIPQVAPPDLETAGRVILFVMLAAIGWAAGAVPADWIVAALKKIILPRR